MTFTPLRQITPAIVYFPPGKVGGVLDVLLTDTYVLRSTVSQNLLFRTSYLCTKYRGLTFIVWSSFYFTSL